MTTVRYIERAKQDTESSWWMWERVISVMEMEMEMVPVTRVRGGCNAVDQ
jgi:hypothetical protein